MKVGLIGCGDWGRNHARVLARFSVLAAVSDCSEERAVDVGVRCGVDVMPPDRLLADPGIDAVVIAVDPRLQAELAQKALLAGKHVLVEKPMALNAADALQVQTAADRAGRVAMTGHILRFHPAFQKLVNLVRDGAIGEIRQALTVRRGFGKFFPGVSALWDLAPHDLSMLLPLAGRPPISAQGRAAKVLTEWHDAAEVDLDFGQGFAATIQLSRVFPGKERRLELIGTRGMAIFDDLAPWPEKLIVARDGSAPEPVQFRETAPLDAQLRHFLDCIAGGQTPLASAGCGHRVLQVLEGMQLEEVSPADLPAASQSSDVPPARMGILR